MSILKLIGKKSLTGENERVLIGAHLGIAKTLFKIKERFYW